MTYADDFTKLIKDTRQALGESQEVFGKRFDVSHASVSMWESGETEAPYKVLYFCFHQPMKPTHSTWTKDFKRERLGELHKIGELPLTRTRYTDYVEALLVETINIMSEHQSQTLIQIKEELRLEQFKYASVNDVYDKGHDDALVKAQSIIQSHIERGEK